jgi:hypothetical protein
VFRRINFANATPNELEQLTQACEVFDEAYCKAGKMDSECFSSSLDPFRTDLMKIIRDCLLEGEESTKNMDVEAYKLNIYSAHLIFVRPVSDIYRYPGKGSSFKPHVDTPRSKKTFGSLVIVFPTHHEGGALFLRHRGHEWIFDPGHALAGGRPSVGYVAFLNDVEQDVAPVTSGHCVTLTYNLYFDDDGVPVSEKDAVSEHLILPKPPNQDGFSKTFEALLENPEFMADGGTLAFGLRHGYPIEKRGLKHVCKVLKGSDAVVYQSARALGFEPTLYMYYDEPCGSFVVDRLIRDAFIDEDKGDSICRYIQMEGGIPVRQGGYHDPDDDGNLKNPEPVEWVTPITTYNRIEGVYANCEKSRLDSIDGDACMIIRIGKVGDRLAYPTVAQIEEAYEWDEEW